MAPASRNAPGPHVPSGLQATSAALLRDRRGATAVEFGLVAFPFLALLGVTVQLTLMVWAQQNLDLTFQKGMRSVLTGQFQTTNDQSADPPTLLAALRTGMCGSGPTPVTIFDCSGVRLDVRVGSSFATSLPAAPVDPITRDWAPGFGTTYTCAPPGAIVVATAAVKLPVLFNLLGSAISTFGDGSRLLQSTQVFRTEPYGRSAC